MKWIRRTLSTILLLAAGLFVVLLIMIQMPFVKQRVVEELNERFSQRLKTRVNLGTLTGFFPFDMTASKVALTDIDSDKPWMTIDSIHISWDPIMLWKNSFHCHLLRFRNPVIHSLPKFQAKSESPLRIKKLIDQYAYSVDIDRLAIIGLKYPALGRDESWTVQGSLALFPRSKQPLAFDLHIITPLMEGAAMECQTKSSDSEVDIVAKLEYYAVKGLPKNYPHLFAKASTSLSWATLNDWITQKGGSLEGPVYCELSSFNRKTPAYLKDLFGRDAKGNGTFSIASNFDTEVKDLVFIGKDCSVSVDAHLTDRYKLIDCQAQVTLKDLSNFSQIAHLNMSGPLIASVDLHGNITRPEIDVNALSSQLLINKRFCQNVTVAGSWQLGEDGGSGALAANGRAEDLPLDVTSDYVYNSQGFAFSNFSIDRMGTHLTGNLAFAPAKAETFPYVLTGNVEGTLPDILVWEFLFPEYIHDIEGSFGVNCQLSATEENAQSLTGDLDIHYLMRGSIDVTMGKAHAELINPFSHPLGKLDITAEEFHAAELDLNDFEGSLDINDDLMPFAFSTTGSFRAPFEAQCAGIYHLNNTQLDVTSFTGEIFEYPIQLQSTASFLKNDELLELSPLSLQIDQGQLQMQIWANSTQAEMEATLTKIPLDLITIAFPQSLFTGTVSGKMELAGNVDGTTGSAQLDIQTASDAPEDREGLSYLPLMGTLNVTFLHNSTHFDANIEGLGKRPLQAELNIPLYFKLFPFQTHLIKTDPIDGFVYWEGELDEVLNLFFIEGSPFAGDLFVHGTATGTLGHPEVKGKISLDNGSYESPVTGALIENIEAVAIADGRTITLDHVTATDSGDGHIAAAGHLTLDDDLSYPYEVTVDFDSATLLQLDLATASFDGSLNLSGNRYTSLLKGNIIVDEAHINIPRQINTRAPTVDVVYKNDLSEHPEDTVVLPTPLNPLTLDLTITAPKKVFVSGRGMTAEWKGDVHITASPLNPELKGILQLIKGEVNLFGRTFAITQGTITFGGKPPKEIYLYVVSQFDVTSYNVRALLQGPLTAPELTFESNPYLPPTEILSRILFGTGVANISPIQGFQLAQALLTISGTYSGPDILSRIQQGIGLDQLTITSTDDEGTTIPVVQAGKYISEGVFVSIDKTLSEDQNTTGFEARLIEEIRVRVEVTEDDENSVLLEWKHDY